VTADVPGEALFVDERSGESTDVKVAFEELPTGMVVFIQIICDAKASGTGAEDSDFHVSIVSSLFADRANTGILSLWTFVKQQQATFSVAILLVYS
jgi:hypothetical protein